MKIVSPATRTTNTRIDEKIDSQKIISLYKEEGIDVQRFFKEIPEVLLVECLDTNYRFFYPSNIFGDGPFYSDLELKIPGYYHVNRWEHVKAIDLIKGKSSLLEVGCGDGAFLQMASKVCDRTLGIEINESAIAKAKAKGLNVEKEFIQDFAKKGGEKFDVVCSFQVLEHITEIDSFIEAMLGVLKKDGILIIAVPNNNPYLFKREKYHFLNLPPHHAGLWNEESLRKVGAKYSLSPLSVLFEPLRELKFWYRAQVKYYKETSPLIGTLLSIIPRQLYKPALRLARNNIQGKTIMAVFQFNQDS